MKINQFNLKPGIFTHLLVAWCILFSASCSTKHELEQENERTDNSSAKLSVSTPETFASRYNTGNKCDLTLTLQTDGSITAVTLTSTATSSDPAKVYCLDIPYSGPGNNEFVIPSGPEKYWLIPFDPTLTPVRTTAGDTYTPTCWCNGTGVGCDIRVLLTDPWNATCFGAGEEPCTCCGIKWSRIVGGGGVTLPPGVIAEATSINYNGVTYN